MMAPLKITDEHVRGLLCCAFEGGSNYWYSDLGVVSLPEGKTMDDYYEGGSMQVGEHYWNWSQLVPTTGGSVSMRVDDDDETYVLDGAAIERGAALFANHQQYGELIAGRDDAITGDVFLQLCLFGSVVYG